MRTISLSQGYMAMVDDEDYPYLIQWKWYARINKKRNAVYAVRKEFLLGYSITIRMHRSVMGLNWEHIEVDHKDGNGLNNQKYNLRKATRSQNACNIPPSKNRTSKYKGVSWQSSRNLWVAQMNFGGKHIYIGRYKNEKEAAVAYNKKAKELQGEFAYINKID